MESSFLLCLILPVLNRDFVVGAASREFICHSVTETVQFCRLFSLISWYWSTEYMFSCILTFCSTRPKSRSESSNVWPGSGNLWSMTIDNCCNNCCNPCNNSSCHRQTMTKFLFWPEHESDQATRCFDLFNQLLLYKNARSALPTSQ